MTNLEHFQAELTIKMGEIDDICKRFKYDVTPTILLRHSEGPSSSMLVGNDSPETIISCVKALSGIGEMYAMSPAEAELRQLLDAAEWKLRKLTNKEKV